MVFFHYFEGLERVAHVDFVVGEYALGLCAAAFEVGALGQPVGAD
ncbi:hypothetical protein [Corynebacterium striatum]